MNMREFMDAMEAAFPGAEMDVDNDGQVVIYTNLQFITSSDNPSIPEGEVIIQPFTD